ncbi:uncharacterized protein [Vulpes vulpes]|uniref:Uncharacterized protein n=1 Tax=Vulpes vulpes TaxID=9627 RepID=A0ABM5AF03_VULVU
MRVNRYIGRLLEAFQMELEMADLDFFTLKYKQADRELKAAWSPGPRCRCGDPACVLAATATDGRSPCLPVPPAPGRDFTSAVVLALILTALFGLIYLLIIPQNVVDLLLLVFCICFLVACVLYLHITRVQLFSTDVFAPRVYKQTDRKDEQRPASQLGEATWSPRVAIGLRDQQRSLFRRARYPVTCNRRASSRGISRREPASCPPCALASPVSPRKQHVLAYCVGRSLPRTWPSSSAGLVPIAGGVWNLRARRARTRVESRWWAGVALLHGPGHPRSQLQRQSHPPAAAGPVTAASEVSGHARPLAPGCGQHVLEGSGP